MIDAFRPVKLWRWLLLAAVLRMGLGEMRAADFNVTEAKLDAQGRPVITVAGDATAYFLLRRGGTLSAISTVTDLRLSDAAPVTLRDPQGLAGTVTYFYRVARVPLTEPEDSDQDGIDDVYELRRSSFLNPLNPADAALDFDGDGKSNRQEYEAGSDPASGVVPTTFMSSPGPNEDEVSVNRETALHFSRPLAAGTLIAADDFFAEFGGRRLLTRIEVNQDLTRASLFYLEPMPGDALVRVGVNGDKLFDQNGVAVDADNDGKAGGLGYFTFNTYSLTPVAQTAVIGQVFASEPGVGGGAPKNTPLPGVIITVDGREQELRAVTDAEGRFKLSPVPAGRFFVHVDGRVAAGSNWPDGDYYPFIGKA